jgi:hypothetical protein
MAYFVEDDVGTHHQSGPTLLGARHSDAPAGVAIHLHPSWQKFLRYCQELGHGEIEKLKIQDGLPMVAEVTMKKVRFVP